MRNGDAENSGWLAGGGEMGARMRAKDWSATTARLPGNLAAKRQNGGQHMPQFAFSDPALAWSRTTDHLQRHLHSLPWRHKASGDARRDRAQGLGGDLGHDRANA